MPQSAQIIPQYEHPFTEVIINDNTVFTDTVSSPPDGVTSVYVITSSKGRDRVLLPWTDTGSYLEEYGTPNFKQFGQPCYMPWATLSTGYAKAWVMRVTAPDSTLANIVVAAKVKTDTTIPASPVVDVYFTALEIPSLDDPNNVSDQVQLILNTTPDTNGYITIPLFCVYMQGRGTYGNAYRIRLIGSPTSDSENGYKNYRLELYELANTLLAKEVPYIGTFDPDALYNGQSLYMSDIVNDPDTGSGKVNVYVNDDGFNRLFTAYKTAIPSTTYTIGTFDFFGGVDSNNTAIPGYAIQTAPTDAIHLDAAVGVNLDGGSDGAFAYSTDPTALAARETAINTEYINAFQGKYDHAILSKRRAPAQYFFDAAYADEVKKALISCLTTRYDAQGYIDAGILNTVTDAVAWGTSMQNYADRIFSKECQNFMIRDPFSGKKIPMTMTYFHASTLPLHVKNNGNQTPFVGDAYAKLVGAIKNSLRPVVDADDEVNKESLYLLRLNYFQSTAENVYSRGTQSTSQNIWSDLSEENNMAVLLELKRKIEGLVSSLSYDFADPADRKTFTETADRLIAPYRGVKLTSATVNFDMNAWETTRSILHCYLAVVFKTMAKRNIVEIDVNPRS